MIERRRNMELKQLEERRVLKYRIKKLSIGVVSCMVGCVIYMGAGTIALAEEPSVFASATSVGDEEFEASMDNTTSSESFDESNVESVPKTEISEESETSESINSDGATALAIKPKLTNGLTTETLDSTVDSVEVNMRANESLVSEETETMDSNDRATSIEQPTALAENGLSGLDTATDKRTKDGYSISITPVPENVCSDPDPSHYTFRVIKDLKSNNQFVYSVSRDDVQSDGTVTSFFITRYDENGDKIGETERLLNQKDMIKTYGNVTIQVTISGVSISGSTFTTLYSQEESSVNGKENQDIVASLPIWLSQTTKYQEVGTHNIVAKDYTQYGWVDSKYTTTPIEIEGYDFVSDTGNQTGTINDISPKFEGDISYQKSVVLSPDNKTKITVYIKREYIDNQGLVRITAYMTPRVDSENGSLPDAEVFFTTLNSQPIAVGKIFSPTAKYYVNITDVDTSDLFTEELLAGKDKDGKTYNEYVSIDPTLFYQYKVFENNDKSISAYLNGKETVDSAKGDTSTFLVPFSQKKLVQQSYLPGKLNLHNSWSTPSTVIYYYSVKKGGEVVAQYVIQGTDIKLKDDEIVQPKDTPVNTEYISTKKNELIKDGLVYELVGHKQGTAPEMGNVKEEKQVVVYEYALKKGSVLVHYKDLNGNDLKPTVTDEENVPNGKNYDTTDHKPTAIISDGKTYRIIENRTEGIEKGKVVPGITEVTYIYKEVTGNVIIHYVDENGNMLKEDVIDTPESSIGTDYNTMDNKPETIVKDGKTYVLIPVATKGSEKGKVVEGVTEITYVYREIIPSNLNKNPKVETPKVTNLNVSTGMDHKIPIKNNVSSVIQSKVTKKEKNESSRFPKTGEGTPSLAIAASGFFLSFGVAVIFFYRKLYNK